MVFYYSLQLFLSEKVSSIISKRKAQDRRPIEVEMGNLQRGVPTHYSKGKSPDLHLVGIDINRPITQVSGIEQRVATFTEGLKGLKDNSVPEIKSTLAVGYYGPRMEFPFANHFAHTLETINLAFRKLLPGGKFSIVVGKTVLADVEAAFGLSRFSLSKVKISPLPKKEQQSTEHTRRLVRAGERLYKITAEK